MKHNAHPDYRPEIDGLRAVAILSVLVYHAFPSLLPGGFIGVDVFFVISGYLISTILFKSHEAGTFSYLDFYIRRARRIFPSLALVLAFSLAAGWWVLIPREFHPFGNQVAYGAGFTANILFIREAGYWDIDSELKPLLHLWSLGVEEQYYLLWPLMIALFWKRSHNFLWIVLPVFVGSFALNVLSLDEWPIGVFYSPLTRFWELMAGGLLAYLTLHRIPQHFWRVIHPDGSAQGGGAANLLSGVGLLLLGLGFVLIDNTRAFPGGWALFPVVGAFLVILGGMDSWVSRYFLAHPVMVYIGLISYPLYLWHWPLLSFLKNIQPNPDWLARLAVVVVAVLLAVLTFHLVEKPVRFRMKGTRAAAYATIFVVALGFMGDLVARKVVSPFHGVRFQEVDDQEAKLRFPGELKTFPLKHFKPVESYLMGEAGKNMILMAGDSHTSQYFPRVSYLFQQNPQPRPVVFIARGGCNPIPKSLLTRAHCKDFGERVFEFAQSPEVTTVVLAASWLYYFDKRGKSWSHNNFQQTLTSLEQTLSTLRKMGKNVYFVSSIPVGSKTYVALNRNIFSLDEFTLKTASDIPMEEIMVVHGEALDAIHSAVIRSGAHLIEPMRYLCDGNVCPAITPQHEPIYDETFHVVPSFTRTHVHYLDEIFLP